MTDHFHEAHKAAEAHIEACWDMLNDEAGDGRVDDRAIDTMAPFCGCMTCEVREILYAAMPHLERGIAAEAGRRADELAARISR